MIRRGFLRFTDLLVLGSLAVNYLNYRYNKRNEKNSRKIAENLEKINGSRVLEKLCEAQEKKTSTPPTL